MEETQHWVPYYHMYETECFSIKTMQSMRYSHAAYSSHNNNVHWVLIYDNKINILMLHSIDDNDTEETDGVIKQNIPDVPAVPDKY